MNNSTEQQSRFAEVIRELSLQRSKIIAELKLGNSSGKLQLKLQFDDAINCLLFCEKYSIISSAKVTKIPEHQTRTPSSEFRIVEDNETENRDFWTELTIENFKVRPSPGDLLLDVGLQQKK